MQITSLLDSTPLGPMLEERDLILVTGKGGTGKSTLVAALAALAVERRGGALAVELALDPRLPPMIAPGVGVELAHIGADSVVGSALGRILGLPTVVSAVLRNRVLQLFVRTSPAVREMILIDELRDLVDRNTRLRRPVIVDLPATGHALTFLDTPRSVRRMLRVGPVAHAAEKAERLVVDASRTELVVVSLPEELPVNETIELLQKAGEIGISSRTVVVNQVPPSALGLDRGWLEVIQNHSEGAVGRFASAARGDLEEADQARAQIQRLRDSVRAQVVEIPRFPGLEPRATVHTMAEALSS